MQLNPFSRINKATEQGQINSTNNPVADQNIDKSKKDSRETAEKLSVVNVESTVPHFKNIKASSDLDTIQVSTDKDKNSQTTNSAKKLLKAMKFDSGPSENEFLKAYIAGPGIDTKTGAAKLVLNMSGEEAINKYFKTGFLYTIFGWLPRLFGGANRSLGIKWLKQNSGFHFFDPAGEHSKMDDPKRIKKLLASGRYFVSVVYKTDQDGNFTKQPEAIVLLDRLEKVIDDMEQKINTIPDQTLQDQTREKIKRLKKEKIYSYCMVNTALINPKNKSLYDKNDNDSLLHREALLSSVFESIGYDTNFIVPNEVFNSKNTQTNKYQYDQIPDMAFIYVNSDQSQVGTFGRTATLVTNKAMNREKIPAKDLSELMGIAMTTEHLSSGSTMIKPLIKAIDDIESKNTKAFETLNAKLGL